MSYQIQTDEVLARLKPFGISFEKSLSDLIKGIRAQSSPEKLSDFLDKSIIECKNELKLTDLEIKATAILKLAYLEMYGFDMSWSNFQILEVMSSSKFQQKRIGYLAAIQSFKNDKDVLILATNQFKKDLNSHNHIEIGLALSGIATVVTPNLAQDINDDVLSKLSHSKPYIRKKAILAMYKIFLQYPDSLKVNFGRIIDKLDDQDSSVISATISVICELSKKTPTLFINYLPQFFELMQNSQNNWLIIRLLKLFQSLSKIEPRLKNKILPSILDLMTKTKASSLIYECINCIINGNMLNPNFREDATIANLCVNEILQFFETKDSNLKFVGLLALIKVIQLFPFFLDTKEQVRQIIMSCLTDDDMIIKSKALEISHLLSSENNLVELVKVLIVQLIPKNDENGSLIEDIPENFKMEISLKIISIASQQNYSLIPNFKWYIAALNDILSLTCLSANTSAETVSIISKALGEQFRNIAVKIPSMRKSKLGEIVGLAKDIKVLQACPDLFKEVFWIIGEFSSDLDLKEKESLLIVLTSFKVDDISKELLKLDGETLSILIQALVKLFNSIVCDFYSTENYHQEQEEPLSDLLKDFTVKSSTFMDVSSQKFVSELRFNAIKQHCFKIIRFLTKFENNLNYEVQERAVSWLEFLKLCLEAMGGPDGLEEIEEALANESSVEEETGDKEEEEEEDSNSELDSESEEDEINKITTNPQGSDMTREEYDDLDSDKEEDKLIIPSYPIEKNPFQEDDSNSSADSVSPGADIGISVPTEQNSPNSTGMGQKELPLLVSFVLPSMFNSYDLNPIAANTQRKIAVPEDLDLDNEIYSPLVFDDSGSEEEGSLFNDSIDFGYSHDEESLAPVYEQDTETIDIRKKLRIERLKDDPFYISDELSTRAQTPSRSDEQEEAENFLVKSRLDSATNSLKAEKKKKKSKTKAHTIIPKKERVVILNEETIEGEELPFVADQAVNKQPIKKKNILRIDSSNLDNFDLNTPTSNTNNNFDYDIDLDQMRNNLLKKHQGETEVKKPKKKSSSKVKKTKKVAQESGVDNKATLVSLSTGETESKPQQVNKDEDEAGKVIEVKKGKKTKRKKAIIEG